MVTKNYDISKSLDKLLLQEIPYPLDERTPDFKRARNTPEDIEPFKDELPGICKEKLSELHQARRRLNEAKELRAKVIRLCPELLSCEIHALVGAYTLQAEEMNIGLWSKYWQNLNPKRKLKDFKRTGFSDNDLEKARNYPIENLLPNPPRQAGAGKLKTHCPFHEEKTPSFVIYTNQNTAHCFGCHTHFNNSVNFLMKLEDLDFKEAVRRLL